MGKANIDNHPLEMTQAEYDGLAEAPPGDDWKYMPEGTRFKQSKDPTVIVEICKGMDMFVDQWGAGLLGGPPEKGLRWYRAVIKAA